MTTLTVRRVKTRILVRTFTTGFLQTGIAFTSSQTHPGRWDRNQFLTPQVPVGKLPTGSE